MDYEKYRFKVSDFVKCIGTYLILTIAFSYFFYRSVKMFIITLPLFLLYKELYTKSLIGKRKKKLTEEFSETLLSVSINMKSGYSLENAFIESYKDIKLFYGEESLMASEIMRIKKGLDINLTIEELMEDLAKRSREKEILMFSEVLKSAKRNGGNITEVLINTAERIRSSICVDKEIDVILSEKKLELRVMEGMPFIILLYLEVTSEGYFDALYAGVKGRIFMTVCLLIYIGAAVIGEKIIKIKV